MPYLHACSIIVLLPAVVLTGCRLVGRDGPVSRSLATCRQLSQQAVAAAERGQHQQAESLLKKAVDACPVDEEARRHYAEALWRRGARPEAVAQLQEAARLAEQDAVVRVRLAEMYLAMGEMQRAGESAEQALDLDPKLPAAWAIRGRVMHAAGEPWQALADYHRSLAYAPDNQQMVLEIAELYRQLGQPQRALAALSSLAESYSPGEEPQQVLYLTGLAYAALGRYEEAVRSLSAAVVRGEATPEMFYDLGEVELAAGRPAEAAVAARHALALQPNHEPSRRLLDRLQLAERPNSPPHQ